ncbi:MAG: menaquinone-dependent protoporphyrinogen oxidase [Kribbellaceae bacterium]|jgi:menaquinone-dependent protoporphyrinogen oxidase|nr:menaquinone-dependent protoporphyrinogen oxidase [Kribbellaceae bacterium]
MIRNKVLVAYASKMGGTAGIAEAIGDQLRKCGHQVDVRNVEEVCSLQHYDAVVLGSAIYARGWRKEAVRFLRHHRDELRERPVWLFHSGPVGPDRDTPQAAPPNLARLIRKIGAAAPQTFAGRLEQESATGVVSRWLAHGQLAGDFRDWPAVRQWAREIHETLRGVAVIPWPADK